MSIPTLFAFIAYLVALLLIGSFAYRATGDLEDYLRGGPEKSDTWISG